MFHYLPKFFTLPLYKVYWNPCCLDTGHPKIPTCRHRLGKQTSSIKHGHLVSCDYYVYYLSITHRPSVLIPPFGARNDGFCCPSTGHHLTNQTCPLKWLSRSPQSLRNLGLHQSSTWVKFYSTCPEGEMFSHVSWCTLVYYWPLTHKFFRNCLSF